MLYCRSQMSRRFFIRCILISLAYTVCNCWVIVCLWRVSIGTPMRLVALLVLRSSWDNYDRNSVTVSPQRAHIWWKYLMKWPMSSARQVYIVICLWRVYLKESIWWDDYIILKYLGVNILLYVSFKWHFLKYFFLLSHSKTQLSAAKTK